MSKHEAIIFQSNFGVVRIIGEWPKYTKLDTSLFAFAPPSLKVNDDGHVVITVANGKAIYKLDAEQDGFYLCLVRVLGDIWEDGK